MPHVPAAAHVVAWVLLGSGVALTLAGQADLRRRLDDADRVAAQAPRETPVATPVADAPAAEVAMLRGRLDASEKRSAENLAAVRSEVHRLWAELLGTAEGDAKAGTAGTPEFDVAVRAVVDRYATEKGFRDAVEKASGPLVPKKPAFAQLVAALQLRPQQVERFGQDVRDIQQELYEILQVPRADGVVPLEEIQTAEQYPEGNPMRAQAFLKLFRLTIPDTQETYFERAIALAVRVKTNVREYFDPQQLKTLDGIDLDWFGIRMQ